MISLGLGINKNINIHKKYVGPLDELGNAENCVYTFSPYKRLTGDYTDELIRVVNNDTIDERFFGADKNGDLEVSEIMTWLNGSVGFVDWICNERKPEHPSVQTDIVQRARITTDDGATFETNGLYFSGEQRYQLDKYSELNITTPPLTAYTNIDNHGDGHIFSINGAGWTEQQYIIRRRGVQAVFYLGDTSGIVINHQTVGTLREWMWLWTSYAANQVKVIDKQGNSVTGTRNSVLPERQFVNVGARSADIANNGEWYWNARIKTIAVFNSDEENKLNDFVSLGI